MLGAFSAMNIAASGLSAQRVRMNTIASNLANARTTRTESGEMYRRIDPVFTSKNVGGLSFGPRPKGVSEVTVDHLVQDQRAGQMVHDPQHPDANQDGYVQLPNIHVVEEMVNMITASRAYEAGISSIESVKSMARSAVEIGG
ncbi:MAG: flagellar basal body rod protein FlgC [Polyangiaceae bacterium]|nr:flagellar basal body rod protein FlgC [Polyangiaceae bacterium]